MTRCLTLACILLAACVTHAAAQAPAARTQARQPRADQAYSARSEGAQVSQPGQPSQTGQLAKGGQAAGLDQAIASCLLLGNNEEVAVAEFAQSRIQNPKVKEFAQMLIQDHEQAISKLSQIAPQLATMAATVRQGQGGQQDANATPGQQPAQGEVGQNLQAATEQGQVGASGTEQQLFALQQSVTKECLALTEKELGELQGPEFDMAFVGCQLGAHIGMLAKLHGSQQFASAELQPIIKECEQTVQKHLDHAKQLKDELKSEAGPRQTSQRPGPTPRAVR